MQDHQFPKPEEEPDPDRDSAEGQHDEPSADQPEVGETNADYPAWQLLTGGDADAILKRLFEGDPLGVKLRVREHLRLQCYLIAFDRLFVRTIARIAHSSFRYRGKPALDEWIAVLINQSIQELMIEDREGERQDLPTRQNDIRYAFLSETLGIHPSAARRGCIRFNDLELGARKAFYALYVEGKTFNRFIAEGNGPPKRARKQMAAALEALSVTELMNDPDDLDTWEELP